MPAPAVFTLYYRRAKAAAVLALALCLAGARAPAAVLVGRADVEPSGGGFEEKPVARLLDTCPAGAPADGGSWVAGFSAEGAGVEANVDFALAWFPFAAGWAGAQAWRYPTEAPVRLASVLYADRVYAGSDDGWLYCLQAATGELLWRYPAAPTDARLPGNQRLISACPVRCGIAIDQATVYFGAGVFPSDGTFLCAVDALTGQARWQEPVHCGPQGFLLLSPTRLFVPTGRTPFQVFDRRTMIKVGDHLVIGTDDGIAAMAARSWAASPPQGPVPAASPGTEAASSSPLTMGASSASPSPPRQPRLPTRRDPRIRALDPRLCRRRQHRLLG